MTIAHSKLGASSMYRWSACAGSVALIDRLIEFGIIKATDEGSFYAQQGSAAHALAEHCLSKDKAAKSFLGSKIIRSGGMWRVTKSGTSRTPIAATIDVDQEMVEGVQLYIDYAKGYISAGTVLVVEQRFDLSEVHEGCFGTADTVIWQPSEALLTVPDFKYGSGVPVEAFANKQLLYYGLGALLATKYPAKRVRVVVVQPRCDHAAGPIREYEVDAEWLLTEFRDQLKRAAELTEEAADELRSWVSGTEPNDEWAAKWLTPGDHCQFCRAAAHCPALEGRAQALAKIEFSPMLPYDPMKLKLALDSRGPLKAWLKALDEFAYREAVEGRPPPDYKIVEKRANRRFADEGEAVGRLQNIGVSAKRIYVPPKVRSIAQLEKELDKGEFAEIADLITRPTAGLALVHESDRRPSVKPSAREAFTDFALIEYQGENA